MSRTGINYLDVADAISKLESQGKAITGDNVRAELGTGSKSTITRLVREWKQNQGLPTDDTSGLPTKLLTPVKELWAHLQAEADDTIYSYKQEYDAAMKEMGQQLNHYKAKETEWQGRVHGLEEKLHQQVEDNKCLNGELIAERQEKIKAIERVEALQSRHQESEAEKERLHQLLKNIQANLEHYQAATQQLRQEQDMVVAKQRADYEQRLFQLQQQIEVMTREKAFLEARCAGLDRDYNASLTRETAVTEEAAQLWQKYTTLEANYATRQRNLDEFSQELSVQRQALEAKHDELVECQLRLGIAEDKIISLQKALSVAEDRIVALRDDYLFVAQEKVLSQFCREGSKMFAMVWGKETEMLSFKWKHFKQSIILMAVRWYLAYAISYRDIEELMAERGVTVDHSTVNRWVIEYAPQLENEFRKKHKSEVGCSWRMDETYVKIKGLWNYLYRAVDKEGKTVDFYLSKNRDKLAAETFFRKAIGDNILPEKVVIDKSGSNKAALESLNLQLALLFWMTGILMPILIRQIKYLNNLVEQDHRAIKKIINPMKGFKSFAAAEATLAGIELHHMLRKGQYADAANMAVYAQFYALAA